MARALLISRKGEGERVVEIPDLPPHTYIVPIPRRFTLEEPTSVMSSLPTYRTFRLNLMFRSHEYQWMRVYNEGRSQTPEDAYVYFEDR